MWRHLWEAISPKWSNYLERIFSIRISTQSKEQKYYCSLLIQFVVIPKTGKMWKKITRFLALNNCVISPCFTGSISACTIVFIVSNGITRHHDIKPAKENIAKWATKLMYLVSQLLQYKIFTRKSASQNRNRYIDVAEFPVAILHLFDLFTFLFHPIRGTKHINCIFISQHIETIWKYIAAKFHRLD